MRHLSSQHPYHGINLMLGSIKTKHNLGIGEFFDLIPLIDWCADIGFQIIQLLPLNDSSFDPSPYNAMSTCAINPVYLSLAKLRFLSTDIHHPFGQFLSFSSLKKIDYQSVLKEKINFLYRYYERFSGEYQKMNRYEEFLEKNEWLYPYCVFKVLKDLFNYQPWMNWPTNCKNPSPTRLKDLYEENRKMCDFYIFLQFLCFDQLKEVHDYATTKRIFLKGDLPILISPESVDVWYYPQYFDLDKAVGSAPDLFFEEGQYWGFPLPRWDVILQDGFSWWKTRLKTASEFYDLFRIDHIVGFFRLWIIDRGRPAMEGAFYPPDEEAFLSLGEELLSLIISNTSMIAIGEDLGTIPPATREILKKLGIYSTKVMRWEKDHDSRYTPVEGYPLLSLTTLSTHDTETLAMWWKHYPREIQQFCEDFNLEYESSLDYNLRLKILTMGHATGSLFHINLLQEYLNLFPELSWEALEDERINIPGKILPGNWTYRFRPYLEEIIQHESLKKIMRLLSRCTKH